MAEGRTTTPKAGRRRIIERPRLTRLLDESPARIKMLVAPAGYGKTTLARQWLASGERRGAWVRCPRGGDAAVFVAAAAEAIGSIMPGAERRLLQRLPITRDTAEEAALLAEIMAEEAQNWPDKAWLVVDDYERLTDSPTSEAFIADFLVNSLVQALILSRAEPAWLTAKQVLYGDVTVVNRAKMAMTTEEVHELIPGDRSAGVVGLARGWAAVLGLVAMSDSASDLARDELLPESLARFLAEELYEGLPQPVRLALWQIAAADAEDESVILHILGDRGAELLQTGEASGWLSRDIPGRISVHPLLKRFLIGRAPTDHPAQQEIVRKMIRTLVQSQRWDEAYALIERYHVDDLHEFFLRAALHPALAAGRLTSVKRWTNFGAEVGASASVVGLARAELAYRDGRFVESEALAVAATSNLAHDDSMRFPALFLAGRAAHTGTRADAALAHYRAARKIARTLDEECQAALGEISAAAELELPETIALLDELRPRIPVERPDLFAIWVGRALWCDAIFARPVDLDAGRWGYQLLGQVNDPIARTAFRNAFSYFLGQAGAIEEARSVLVSQRDEAASLRLRFVEMYADHVDALLDLIVGDLDSAEAKLQQLERDARDAMDNFLLSNVICLRVRLLLARGAVDEAIAVSFASHGPTANAMLAEIHASRALAYACGARGRDAVSEVDAAAATSQASEVRVLRASALAVVATLEGRPDAPDLAEAAIGTATHHRIMEPFIAAYRGCPELCILLFRINERRSDLRRILTIGNDLARFEPPPAASEGGTWRDLSPREREVLSLVAAGMSNREIANSLYISEATAKVHVRHILEKLGVRSRIEAALRAPLSPTPRPRE